MNFEQAVFNIIVSIAVLFGGWILNTMWGAIKDTQKDHMELTEKVNAVEVLVAGQYVTRAEFNQTFNSVSEKLDKIAEKVGATH